MDPRTRLLEQFVVTPGRAAGMAGRDPGWNGSPEFPDLHGDDLPRRATDAIASGSAELSDAQELLFSAADARVVLAALGAPEAALDRDAYDLDDLAAGALAVRVHVSVPCGLKALLAP